MKISDLMTSDPITCLPNTNLAEAASLMLQGDCGILPVVSEGKIRGVVTDRDLHRGRHPQPAAVNHHRRRGDAGTVVYLRPGR